MYSVLFYNYGINLSYGLWKIQFFTLLGYKISKNIDEGS